MNQNQNIQNWLINLYNELKIENLKINSVMSAINETIVFIKKNNMFSKRISISKNLSILLYESGTVEVHCSIKEVVSTYESFKE